MVLSIYFSQDLIQKLSNIFIQDLAPGTGFMITRRGLFEAAVGAVAFESSGALAAPAASTAGQDDALLWLLPLLPAGTRAEAALETIAVKKPLIRLTERRPNYEAPLSYLRTLMKFGAGEGIRTLDPNLGEDWPCSCKSLILGEFIASLNFRAPRLLD
jgi:hypothetical protein